MIQYVIFGVLIYLVLMNEDKSYLTKHKEICRNCGKEIDSALLYCPYCQEKVRKECDSCGKLIYADWRYCPFCEEKNYEDKILGGLNYEK